ncbi:hypothetical protein [Undibacterium flavidum]|uniref:Uncharacterized protein n=1 Tax=Undibacterium flavidum TaxID=2762297 RepID=A0ABR6Y791_9BURK|nr:hypothetical protein [Undibacterium flavidum]MBC3872032.1 hypothetical protein [Undibacterium flavidum]
MELTALTSTLDLLKKGREKLVADFTHNDIELYTDLFKYENNQELMALARCRFKMSWIAFHYELFDSLQEQTPRSTGIVFRECVLQLLDHLRLTNDVDNRSSEWSLVKDLIEETNSLLAGQFDFSNKDDARYKRLLFAKHKEKALFERIFAQKLGEKNELDG